MFHELFIAEKIRAFCRGILLKYIINNYSLYISPGRPGRFGSLFLSKKMFDFFRFHYGILTQPIYVLQMIRAFVPAMKKRNDGHIVATSSLAAFSCAANIVPYAATKYGVTGEYFSDDIII